MGSPDQVFTLSCVLTADVSKLIIDKEKILGRRVGHFNGALNSPPPSTMKPWTDCPRPQPTSQWTSFLLLRSNVKAPGADSVPAEIYNGGGNGYNRETPSFVRASLGLRESSSRLQGRLRHLSVHSKGKQKGL